MAIPKSFIHLDGVLRFPDPAWRHEMATLPAAPVSSLGKRRESSQLSGPWAVVILGPNGSGKTTLYRTRLSRLWPGVPFINADEIILANMGTQISTQVHAELGQNLVSERLSALVDARQDFVWETVFSHPSRISRLLDWKAAGYEVAIVGLHPGNLGTSIQRVARRVIQGGHSVPEDRIRDRFLRTPGLMAQASKIVDASWWLDTSQEDAPPMVVARWERGELVSPTADLPQWAQTLVP